MSLLTPDPLKTVIFAAVSCSGITCPVPNLGETVTFFPSDDVYMTNMLEPVIDEPWPRATHSYDVGADNWKKMSPSPELAVVSGMLRE